MGNVCNNGNRKFYCDAGFDNGKLGTLSNVGGFARYDGANPVGNNCIYARFNRVFTVLWKTRGYFSEE